MIVPFGVTTGFSLAAEVREIAAYYAVRARDVRRANRHQHQSIVLARHALMWSLTERRKMARADVARWLRSTAEAVRKGAAEHQRRIDHFCATSGLLPADAEAKEDEHGTG